jgi:hypothetical protein
MQRSGSYHGVEVYVAPVLGEHVGTELGQNTFNALLSGNRVKNPENPGGNITIVNLRNQEVPDVARTLTVWKSPRQLQEQFKFPEFLGNFSKEAVVISTARLAPAESRCFRP